MNGGVQFAGFGDLGMRGDDGMLPPKGEHVYSMGHSFHVFMPKILDQIAKSASNFEHKQVGLSSIGGAFVIQHWNFANEKFNSMF